MNTCDEWGGLREVWQKGQAVDIRKLRDKVNRKQWRMRAEVALELMVTAVAIEQSVRLLMLPEAALRWKAWSIVALILLLTLQCLYLHIRRGTWRASGVDVTSLLQLTMKRARSGIRLAALNIGGVLFVVAITLLVASPELAPSRWMHDPKLKMLIFVQVAVNAPILLLILIFCLRYIQRQKRKVLQINELLSRYRE